MNPSAPDATQHPVSHFNNLPALAGIKNIALNFGLAVVIVVFLLGLTEIGTRVYLRIGNPPPRTLLEHRLLQPEPYLDASYFSAAFIKESFRQPGGWTTPKDTRLFIPNDFSGQFFHIQDGKRRTVGQPKTYTHRVLMFGGSTVYCSEVPDAWTLPSVLQRRLNDAFPNTYRVENLGATTVHSGQQLERLLDTPLAPGDTVIFYDGVNDFLQGVLYQRPEGWIIQENHKTMNAGGLFESRYRQLKYYAHTYSAFLRYFAQSKDLSIPSHLHDEERLAALVQRTTTQLESNIRTAHAFVSDHKGRFVHFLQPHLLIQSRLSDYEQSLVDNPYVIRPGVSIAARSTDPAFRHMHHALSDQGIESHDLSRLLESRPENEEYYLDLGHVNHKGNQRVADAIFEHVIATPQPATNLSQR